ncbi:MAG: hypothetical protein HOA76_03270 [Gammaproteobacteria bacterium]|jgi:hypothetical protein|nr:hypothetical protein [Gammaproteobacteria bacterium]MBT5643598.1 hypothetical protein [Gammaproteobacteria bacterium]MBT6734310.1 hypothetical protein [Gammaproteobacteria bacterium]
MKIRSVLTSDDIFTRVINDQIIKNSCADTSYICIILTFSRHSDKSLIPTVKVNNDIREYLCNGPTKGYVGNLSCSHQGINNPNSYYIKFNLNNVKNNIDELIYKLTCKIGLKYKCSWCSYVRNGIVRNIRLHY